MSREPSAATWQRTCSSGVVVFYGIAPHGDGWLTDCRYPDSSYWYGSGINAPCSTRALAQAALDAYGESHDGWTRIQKEQPMSKETIEGHVTAAQVIEDTGGLVELRVHVKGPYTLQGVGKVTLTPAPPEPEPEPVQKLWVGDRVSLCINGSQWTDYTVTCLPANGSVDFVDDYGQPNGYDKEAYFWAGSNSVEAGHAKFIRPARDAVFQNGGGAVYQVAWNGLNGLKGTLPWAITRWSRSWAGPNFDGRFATPEAASTELWNRAKAGKWTRVA